MPAQGSIEGYEMDLPSADVVPMVAMVIGATSPLGCRLTASLALHGARLSLLGDKSEKLEMEQVGRLATCLGSPMCDIHELDMGVAAQAAAKTLRGTGAQAESQEDIQTDAEEAAGAAAGVAAEQAQIRVKQSGKMPDEGPPTESLAMVVETVLSRQGRVDLIVSCPMGSTPAAWHSSEYQVQQLATTQVVAARLATILLAPPSPRHQALITITTADNTPLREWTKDLPEHLTAAAAHNTTGTSGPSAEGLSAAERSAAAQELLMVNLVLPDRLQEDDMPRVSRDVTEAVIGALKDWKQHMHEHKAPRPNGAQHPTEIILSAPNATASTTGSIISSSGSKARPADDATPPGDMPDDMSVLHRLSNLLLDPSHPLQDTRTSGAAAGVAEAPAAPDTISSSGSSGKASHAPGLASSPPHVVHQHKSEEQQLCADMINIAASYTDSKGGGASAAVLRGGGGSRVLTVHQEDQLVRQALRMLMSDVQPTANLEATKVQGQDPSPRPGATYRAPDPSSAVWVRPSSTQLSGIMLATGARAPLGLLSRPRIHMEGHDGLELHKAPAALPGVVLTPADPNNLEPEAGKAYKGDPPRHPSILVHCFKPFNGETPHVLLADAFLTPPELFYVRNHLPVPTQLKADNHSVELSGVGISSGPLHISLDDLKSGKWGPIVRRQATLQCAGNRRSEMAAVKLVEGRAPWNHGSIGNAEWTGVELRGVLLRAGLQDLLLPPDNLDTFAATTGLDTSVPGCAALAVADAMAALGRRLHVVMEGWDQHAESGTQFETSISLSKVLDVCGGVMLAWEMDGKELLPDHGYPLRVVVPGFVGTRSVKWLRRITLSETESQSPWQQKDYKLMPQRYTTLSAADWQSMPPIMDMNVQSAILLPEPGSVIDASTSEAIWFRGYAWCGGGLAISRVDVSADEGATWERADIVEHHTDPKTGRTWSWAKWQIPLEIPAKLRASGGKWRVCCKAFNINGDSQPSPIGAVWNFRGLEGNPWHFANLAVKGTAA